MDYSRRLLADRLASEFVLGTLGGPARRRFENLLPAHPALRRAVAAWQDALAPLASTVAPVEPSPAAWAGIEARLFGAERSAPGGAPPRRWWQRLALWRTVSGLATVAALALGLALIAPRSAAPPLLIVMSPNASAAAAEGLIAKARFVASVSADGRGLVLRPLEALPLEAGRALELWALPAQGAPRSLGLVAADQSTRLQRTRLLDDTTAFAVSVEPAGGSPTGAPTGPVISIGKLES